MSTFLIVFIMLAIVGIIWVFYPLVNRKAYQITRDNWGFPWHFILANQGVKLLGALGMGLLHWPVHTAMGWAAVAVIALGMGYEYYQKKTGLNTRKNFLQDVAANWVGVALALIW